MPSNSSINRPGAPTNPPQHLFAAPVREQGATVPTSREGIALPTGENTSPDPAEGLPPGHDPGVADPHPSNEEHPYRGKDPDGANPPKPDIGPNPAAHDGTPPPRPDNAAHGPKFSPG